MLTPAFHSLRKRPRACRVFHRCHRIDRHVCRPNIAAIPRRVRLLRRDPFNFYREPARAIQGVRVAAGAVIHVLLMHEAGVNISAVAEPRLRARDKMREARVQVVTSVALNCADLRRAAKLVLNCGCAHNTCNTQVLLCAWEAQWASLGSWSPLN